MLASYLFSHQPLSPGKQALPNPENAKPAINIPLNGGINDQMQNILGPFSLESEGNGKLENTVKYWTTSCLTCLYQQLSSIALTGLSHGECSTRVINLKLSQF
jgi:hypothetical protein